MRHPIVVESGGGEYMENVLVIEWRAKNGDAIKAGDVVVVVETAKAATEMAATHSGYLVDIAYKAGVEAPIGAVLGYIADEETSSVGDKPVPDVVAVKRTLPDASTLETSRTDFAATSNGRIIATPLARRLAQQMGVDLRGISGSGPRGRIKAIDVTSAERQTGSVQSSTQPGSKQRGASAADVLRLFAEGSYETVPHDGMRRTIARRLTEAKSSIPHIYLKVDCQIDALLDLRARLNDAASLRRDPNAPSSKTKISVNDMVIKAMATALRVVPDANVSWSEDAMIKHRHVDVAVAVSVPGGLITPIVRNADEKSLSAISREMKDLAERARNHKLKAEEFQGGTTAVSNLGMSGVKEFSAIINPPHATILAVGAGEQRPVVVDGALSVANVMTVTLSADHRAVDGALGADLLIAFKNAIENPIILLM